MGGNRQYAIGFMVRQSSCSTVTICCVCGRLSLIAYRLLLIAFYQNTTFNKTAKPKTIAPSTAGRRYQANSRSCGLSVSE